MITLSRDYPRSFQDANNNTTEVFFVELNKSRKVTFFSSFKDEPYYLVLMIKKTSNLLLH